VEAKFKIVSQPLRQRLPDRRTSNRKSPTLFKNISLNEETNLVSISS